MTETLIAPRTHPSELLAIAMRHRADGDLGAATEAVEQACAALEGGDHEPILVSRARLVRGMVAADRGEHVIASSIFSCVARSASTGTAWDRLRVQAIVAQGVLLRQRARHSESERFLRRAVRLAREPDSRAQAHNELGLTHRRAGRPRRAWVSFETARRLLERGYVLPHPELAAVHRNLSGLAHAHGDLTSAVAAARAALAIRIGTCAADDPMILADEEALVGVLVAGGRADEALAVLEGLLPAVELRYGPYHRETAAVLHNFGAAALRAGDLPRAEALLTRCLGVKGRVFGVDHPELAGTHCHLGVVLCTAGDRIGGAGHLRRALAILRAAGDPEHPVAARCRAALSVAGL
ncbi:tetratricopeptide repeat protein [Pseudonocardia sp. GCM10023141]|uniref:tetratricopeptide repeat protein n=1 Tax=Pseudonocardia sp. GCM10023141 TaxID=3252653 RepID=UPI00362075F1